MTGSERLQRLAVAQALQNAVKPMLDQRRPGSERAEADDALRELYATDGVDRQRIRINGEDVGTLSLRFSKGRDGVEPAIEDSERLVRWLRGSDGGLDALRRLVYGEPGLVLKAATADGELPDGCRMREVHEPSAISGTALRVDAAKVAKALAGELPAAVAGLLGGDAS